MLSICKYKTFIVKMLKDQMKVKMQDPFAKDVVELIIGLNWILLLLELVYTLIKYAQERDVYVYDFVEAIKIGISKLYKLYVDLECKFKDEVLINAFP